MARATVSPPTPESKTPIGASGPLTSHSPSTGQRGADQGEIDEGGIDQSGVDQSALPAGQQVAHPPTRTNAPPKRSRHHPAARPTTRCPRPRTAPPPA